jgi:four helix bundle protein
MPEKKKIDRYEQLVAWQAADALADLVESMISTKPAANDFDFCKQIRRSTAKAPAQIAEGFVRFGARESAYYYRVARASLAETQNHLSRGLKRKYWIEDQYKKAWGLSETALKTTTGLLKSRLKKIREEEQQEQQRRSKPPQAPGP